jgi:hypothetical protein
MSGIGRFLFVVLRERENEEREEIDPFTREETRERTRDTKRAGAIWSIHAAGNRKEKNSDLNCDIILF